MNFQFELRFHERLLFPHNMFFFQVRTDISYQFVYNIKTDKNSYQQYISS